MRISSHSAQLAGDDDEQRLERELRREVQLLEPPPGLAHRLGRALGADDPLARRVLAELRQLVEMDRRGARRRRRPRRGRGTTPRAPRAARGAPPARRRARRASRCCSASRAVRSSPAIRASSSSRASRGACLRVRDQRRCRVGGIERRVAVDGARLIEQRAAPRRGGRVEQPLEPVEPPRGDARERRALLVGELAARARRRARGSRAPRAAGTARAGSATGSSRAAARGRLRSARSPRTPAAPRDP